MTEKQLIALRLINQHLSIKKFTKPEDVVSYFGAMQAQDYHGALWAIALRMNASVVESDIEKAISERKIIRGWPMRGTLHFVNPATFPWMLKHLTPRVISRAASVYRAAGVDEKSFSKSQKILTAALEGGKVLTRAATYQVLEDEGISTKNSRGLHILGVLAQRRIICLGPREGKQPTFTLFDEWIKPGSIPNFDEGVGDFALQYFKSHGPASTEDLMWWGGLTKAEATMAIEMNKENLDAVLVDGKKFWMAGRTVKSTSKKRVYELLPFYDEYTVAYQDRSSLLHSKHLKKHYGKLLSSVVMMDGKIVGTWKRTIRKDGVEIKVSGFEKLGAKEKELIEKAAGRYGKFIGKEVGVRF